MDFRNSVEYKVINHIGSKEFIVRQTLQNMFWNRLLTDLFDIDGGEK